ncbi:uncharacterized protein LOC143061969 [Mytilus galloprovincialis]|uniref:uncharacterized protein LOC143061969 n=1 Tax=Mytilus galloprovincialis TaxID=29158 RepID=UPI003F7BC8CA
MLVIFIVYLLFTQAICIDKDDPHACLDTNLSEYYCCSGYEDLNGKCTACKLGFKSRNGQPCMPCPENIYGHGCSSLCECSALHRCDHVRGCVLKEVSSTDYSITGPVEVSTYEGMTVSISGVND